jgi:hypothetical protein
MYNQEKIETFISAHLAGNLYTSAPADQRRAALTMAVFDVLARTGENVDRESDLFAAAAGEQAIFLLLNCGRLNTPVPEFISETVEGAGSVTYNGDYVTAFFSPRAMELCKALKRSSLTLRRG